MQVRSFFLEASNLYIHKGFIIKRTSISDRAKRRLQGQTRVHKINRKLSIRKEGAVSLLFGEHESQERDSTIEGSVSFEFDAILHEGFKPRVYVGTA